MLKSERNVDSASSMDIFGHTYGVTYLVAHIYGIFAL